MYYIEHFEKTKFKPWHLVNCHIVSDYCTRKLIASLKKQGYIYNNNLKAYCLTTGISDNRFLIHKRYIK